MHASSHELFGEFVAIHLDGHRGTPLEIVDFGSQMIADEQASYCDHLDDAAWNYRGVDIVDGRNVDVTLADPYRWEELASESVDLFVSGQAFEHVEHFWVTMFEVARVLKPGGLAVIIAPSSGEEHRFPVDCWRFYTDGVAALARYVQCEVVDAFTDWGNGEWGDTVLVARKPIWTDDERERFDRRAGLQRLLPTEQSITAARITDEWQFLPQRGAAPSVLADAAPGVFTKRLEARRDARVHGEHAEAEAEQRRRDHERHQLEHAVAALTAENSTLHHRLAEADEARTAAEAAAQVSPVVRLYGSARAKVADAAGDRGRQWYKQLRGRD